MNYISIIKVRSLLKIGAVFLFGLGRQDLGYFLSPFVLTGRVDSTLQVSDLL